MTATTTVVSRGAMLFLRGHPHVCDALPDDSEPRLQREFHEHVRASFDRLANYGVLEQSHPDDDCNAGSVRWYWRVPSDVQPVIERYTPDRTRTPCGRTSIRTIEPRETYSCTADDDVCDCRFGPERAREVLG